MVGAPLFSMILATIGLFMLLQAIVEWVWGADAATSGVIENPFGLDTFSIGSTTILRVDVASLGLAVLLMVGFFVMFEFTRAGLAMRATAIDPEAALAQGINVNGVVALSWIIAGVAAAVAGTMLGSNATPTVGLNATLIALVALRAFPAMVLGGLDSPLGALVGGLIIGLLESYALTFIPAENVGQFAAVLPYLVMIAVLLVRPYGLFGTAEVRRI
jgi:branched-chain amino acid transport system permease protein